MARAPSPAFRAWVDAARAVPIAEIANAHALPLRGGVERVGPCPACGGRDRFGINTRKNTFVCRNGCPDGKGGGGPIDLEILVTGCSFKAAVERLTGQAPPDGPGEAIPPEVLAAQEAERAQRLAQAASAAARWSERERTRAFEIWSGGLKDPVGTPVEAYLALRGLSLPPGAALRFRPNFPLFHERTLEDGRREHVEVHRGPVMLGGMTGPDGHFSGVHITWIDLRRPKGRAEVFDRETGEVVPTKKMRGTKKAARIDLTRPARPRRMVLGEGIESTLSIRDALRNVGEPTEDILFASASDLGNLGGPHLASVRHPTERRPDKLGRLMPVQIPGPDPDLAQPAIAIPDSVAELITLGDGDSEPVLTRHAHARAKARHTTPTRVVRSAFAPAGFDFNSLLKGQP